MNKLEKIPLNSKASRRLLNAALVIADDYNKVVETVNEVIDEVALLALGVTTKYLYAATTTQTGANAPVATELENTLGTVTWARTSTGTYTATSDGLFTEGKTLPNANPETFTDNTTGDKIIVVRTSANVITVTTTDSFDVLTDGLLTDRYLEFVVYL